ncbi:MAG TPA: BON domain-containing protein [Acidobacteriota bacterium]|nr:BON domain-containing protein [Acidobacteriota bacterium]
MNSRRLSIFAFLLFVAVAISGCAAKNNNPVVTGTTGITPTSGGTTGTGSAGSTNALPGKPSSPGASDQPRPTDPGNEHDGRIKNEVTEKLKNAGFSQIDVDVDDGIVTLKGSVASSEDKDRAVKFAWSVANVKDVVPQLNTAQ